MTTKVSFPQSWAGTNRVTPPPARSHECPGGPYSDRLPDPTVTILAEIERGGPDDRGFGSRR